MLRKLAERLSRGVVLKRHLPREFRRIPLYVSPEAALGYWRINLRNVDRTLLQLARTRVASHAIVWDIGANVGLFSFAAAAMAGSSGFVLAVEPDSWLVQLLHKSRAAQRPGVAPVQILHAAVADHPGSAILHIAKRSRSSNFLVGQGSTQTHGVRATEEVNVVTLDSLLQRFPAPTVLKIDVEGMENSLLAGAEQVLRSVRPVIICEVTEDPGETTRLLQKAEYFLYDADTGHPSSTASYNTLAIPKVSSNAATS